MAACFATSVHFRRDVALRRRNQWGYIRRVTDRREQLRKTRPSCRRLPRPRRISLPDAGRVAHFWSWLAAGAVIVVTLSVTLVLLVGGPGQRELDSGEPVAGLAVLAFGGWIVFRGVRWRSLLVVYAGFVLVALGILGLMGLSTCQGGCEGAGG